MVQILLFTIIFGESIIKALILAANFYELIIWTHFALFKRIHQHMLDLISAADAYHSILLKQS